MYFCWPTSTMCRRDAKMILRPTLEHLQVFPTVVRQFDPCATISSGWRVILWCVVPLLIIKLQNICLNTVLPGGVRGGGGVLGELTSQCYNYSSHVTRYGTTVHMNSFKKCSKQSRQRLANVSAFTYRHCPKLLELNKWYCLLIYYSLHI